MTQTTVKDSPVPSKHSLEERIAAAAAFAVAEGAKEVLPVVASPPVVPAQTPPASPAAAPPAPRPMRPLPERFIRAINSSEGDFGTVWGATIPIGTPWEHVIQDEFWAMRAPSMHEWDTIHARDEGGNYYAILLVRKLRTEGMQRGVNRATVQVLTRYDLNPVSTNVDVSDIEVAYRGRDDKWCLIEATTKVMLQRGFAEPNDAIRAREVIGHNRLIKTPSRTAA
jgi:hypothetical protein